MSDVVVSVRVSRELREELRRHGVRVSEVVRRALEEELRRRRLERLKKAAANLGVFFAKMPDEEIVERVKRVRMER